MQYWSNEASVENEKTLFHYSSLHYSTAPEVQLDGTEKLITLPHPMQFVIRTLLILVAAVFVFSELVAAAIVFKPGKKPDFVMPGEEEISGNAAELFQIAQSAEKEGNIKRAIKAYKSLGDQSLQEPRQTSPQRCPRAWGALSRRSVKRTRGRVPPRGGIICPIG